MGSIRIRYDDTNKQRLTWLDIARGIGIILVVLGHSVTTVIRENSAVAMKIYDVVYSFHMPLLFFISGTAFALRAEKYKKTGILPYIADKAKRLMIPYVLYSLLVYLCFYVANLIPALASKLVSIGYGKVSFTEWLYQLVSGENLYTQHLWYIYSLFIISVIAFLVVKLTGSFQRIAAGALAFVFIIVLYYLNIKLGVLLWKTTYSAIWFMFGMAIGIKSEMKDRNKILLILFVPVMILLKGNIPLPQNSFLRTPLTLLTVLSIILGIIALSQLLARIPFKGLEWLGKNSFPVYLFHQPFFGSGMGVVLYGILKLPVALCIILSCVVSIAVPALIGVLIDRSKFKPGKILIGKW